MPGNIRPPRRNAQDHEISDMRAEISELRRDMAQMMRVMTETAARSNPAPQPQNGLSEQVLLTLLERERRRADDAAERLLAASDPAHQIDRLVALSDLLPTKEPDDDNDMLKGALMALGSVILEKMDSDTEDDVGSPPYQADAQGAEDQHIEPFEPLFTAVDSEQRPTPPSHSSVELGS